MEMYGLIIKKKKTKKISDEELEELYNVFAYQELPYPTGAKNEFKISPVNKEGRKADTC